MISLEFKAAVYEVLKSTKCNCGDNYLYILILNELDIYNNDI